MSKGIKMTAKALILSGLAVLGLVSVYGVAHHIVTPGEFAAVMICGFFAATAALFD